MKKLYILFAFILGVFIKVNAQEIKVSLNVDPNPNPQISEWVDRTELAMLTIVNTNEKLEGFEYKIQTKIYRDSELVVETKTSQIPIMYLPFGSETFLADEIVPYNALTFYGDIEKTVIQTGLLPAGMYSFCVSLVDLKGNLLTRQESICKPMVITDYQLPELIFPIENTTISAQNLPSTIFTWSPIAPTPAGDEGVKYIIAIPDDSIAAFSETLPLKNKLVVHTSGSVSMDSLSEKNRKGVFYPLQTFSKNREVNFNCIPICVEARDARDIKLLTNLGKSLSIKVVEVNSEERSKLHLAAVFVNNFTNQMFRIAHEITESYGAEFDILKPLIKETARKLDELSPFLAQTGPAKRNDKKTIKKHLKLLEDKHHKDVYELFTKSIQKTHGSKKL